MSVVLRIALIAMSILSLWYALRKIRKAQMQIQDSLFWILCALGLVLFSVFPQLVTWGAQFLGVMTETNFLFLLFIFILLFKVFSLSLRLSQQQTKITALIQHIALEEAKSQEQPEREGQAV